MEKEVSYKSTITACFISSISQAIVVNLPPLLFVFYASAFAIPLPLIGLLVTIGFITQLLTDLAASKFAVKLGYRFCTILAHALSATGLVALGILPLFITPYAGLLIAFFVMSVGAGLIEVLTSPIIDAIPAKSKSAAMSLLHSFYCWGAVAVILLTTLFFLTPSFARLEWLLPALWAVIPLLGLVLYCIAPFPPREEEKVAPYKKLFSNKVFWLLLIIMICSGAAEQAIAQWTSLFAELGLGVSKSTGNLLGACAFALLMGTSRLLYGIFGSKINLKKTLIAGAGLTAIAYCATIFVPNQIVNLIGCALCGLGIGMAWPGALSLGSRKIPAGGTTLFALLALGGDVGCSIGPGLVGLISGMVTNLSLPSFFGADVLGSLKMGLLFALAFPLILFCSLFFIKSSKQKNKPLFKK